jgi:hypothetical protein
VLAIPRGAVPMGAQLAAALHGVRACARSPTRWCASRPRPSSTP